MDKCGECFLYVWFQIGTQNSLELIDDPRAAAVEEVAAKLGLRKVTPVLLLNFRCV